MDKDLFNPPGIVRTVDALAELAAQINAEHHHVEQALRAGLEHAKRAGDLLREAKKQCKHGEWLPWLKKHVRFSERTAQAYMRVSKRWPELEAKAQGLADLTFEDSLKLLAAPADEPAEIATPIPAPPSTPASVPRTVEDLRRELWTLQWREAGVKVPATTGGELREILVSKGFVPESSAPKDDETWNAILYQLLTERGAAYMIHHGDKKRLACPGDLTYNGKKWEGPKADQQRAGCWEIKVACEAGKFINWAEKAGIWHRSGNQCSLRLPDETYPDMKAAAGAKKALQLDLEEYGRDKDQPLSDEEVAGLFDVDLPRLPEALFNYVCGHTHAFFADVT